MGMGLFNWNTGTLFWMVRNHRRWIVIARSTLLLNTVWDKCSSEGVRELALREMLGEIRECKQLDLERDEKMFHILV